MPVGFLLTGAEFIAYYAALESLRDVLDDTQSMTCIVLLNTTSMIDALLVRMLFYNAAW